MTLCRRFKNCFRLHRYLSQRQPFSAALFLIRCRSSSLTPPDWFSIPTFCLSSVAYSWVWNIPPERSLVFPHPWHVLRFCARPHLPYWPPGWLEFPCSISRSLLFKAVPWIFLAFFIAYLSKEVGRHPFFVDSCRLHSAALLPTRDRK